jgi:hypothetical protein
MYWIVFFGLIIFIFSLALNAIYVFCYIWVDKGSRARRSGQYLSGLFISILTIALLVELFFVFFAQPDPYIHTLAARNWFKRYWRLNSLGYRDVEWTPEAQEGRTKILVLGDSIVAGHGLEDEKTRFSNRLGQMLGDDYAVMNGGVHGQGTKAQLKAALVYPYSPDVLVLSIHVDDVVDTATSIGVIRPNFVPSSPRLVEESYAANYLYWHFYRPVPWEWDQRYQNWALGLYTDPGVWETYRSLLLDITRFAKERDIQLIVITFPNLQDVENSRPVVSRIIDLYRGENVPVLDVLDLIEGVEPHELMVNEVDWHPNEVLHQLVAEELHLMVLAAQ